MVKNFDNEIYAYALENSAEHGEAREGNVLPKLFQHGLTKDKIKDVILRVKEIIKEVNSLDESQRTAKLEKYKKYLKEKEVVEHGLKDLPNLSKKMVFRLAPFPSGSLHIGNTKTYLLNAIYAEKYKGKIILVIDDTIGSDEKGIILEAYKLIPEAFDYLNVKYSKPIVYKSDRLEIYYKYAEEILKKDAAYVCSCPQEILRENRAKGIACKCRKLSVEDNLKRWKEMFSVEEGKYVMRLKTDIKHKNPAFRDRVLFRISDKEHSRIGKKYRVWPLLEFSWAIDDHLLGVTHVIRGKELMIEGDMQNFIWDLFGWKKVEFIYTGLVKVEGIGGKLSKSKAQKEVLSGEYFGWEDPRTWSVQSFINRGILAESLREFVEKIGLNQKDAAVPIDDLYAINRRKLDAEANRYFFVENPVEILIKDFAKTKLKEVKMKVHPEKIKTRNVLISEKICIPSTDFNDLKNEEKFRLMHLSDAIIDKKKKKVNLVDNSKDMKTKKVHFVDSSSGVKTKVMMPTGAWHFGVAEKNISKLKEGEIIQFERFGFCKFHGRDRFSGEFVFWFAHD